MSGPANVTSIEAIRRFKSALQEFEADVRDAVTQLLLEVRRELDWVEVDRARYWPREFQRASDGVAEARHELERREMALRPEDKRSCYEAKLALDAAKRRLRLTERKLRAVRRWRVTVHRETDRFEGRLARLSDFLDTELQRAYASLDRMSTALDRYAEQRRPVGRSPGVASSGESPPAAPSSGAEDRE
jgi:hypothetical protein